jgi:hypothetical protein
VSKLYRLSGSTWGDVSGATYATVSDDVWEFAQFGTNILATNYTDHIQGAAIGSGNFADWFTSTNKPKARHMDVIRDQLVLGNTSDSVDGVKPARVWWSAIDNSLDMDPAAATQADYQDLPDGGWVQRVIGGVEYGLILQETAIRRMTYVGSPLVYQFDAIDRSRGTPIPNSAIAYGRNVFFISDDGFFVNNGATSEPIGDEKVDRTFWAQFGISYAARVSAAVDPVNKLVMWAFPGTGHTLGAPNKIYMFHWPTGKWAEADFNLEVILRALSKGYTLDGLDAVSTNIETLGFSLDSRAWTGNVIKLAAFDQSHILNFFDGSNVAGTIDTGDIQPQANGLSTISSVRPLIDGDSAVTVQVASRLRPQDTVSYGTAATIDTDGKCSFTQTSRYHRFRTNITAGASWTHAQGVQIEYADAGGA